MDQLVEVLQEIRDGIYSMNSNIEDLKISLEELKGTGLYNSISDVYDKLGDINTTSEGIKGSGLYDSISDVCEKLDSVTGAIEAISVNGIYTLQDMYNK